METIIKFFGLATVGAAGGFLFITFPFGLAWGLGIWNIPPLTLFVCMGIGAFLTVGWGFKRKG